MIPTPSYGSRAPARPSQSTAVSSTMFNLYVDQNPTIMVSALVTH